jgi:O-antigen ligase
VVSFIGYLMVTFLYEIPFICNIETRNFFRVFNRVFIFVLIYATSVIGYFTISEGSLIYSENSIRNFLILYPNHFAILLILIYWIRQYLVEKNNRLIDIWIIVLIFISFSRVAIATFIVSWVLNTIMNKDIATLKKVGILVAVICLLLPISIYLMDLKQQLPGNTLERTFYGRVARWEAALEYIKYNPIVGSGFDRTTDVVSSYRWFDGREFNLGSMHNDYLDLATKGGILSIICFVAILIGIFVAGVKYNRVLILLLLTIMLTAFLQNPIKNIPIMFCLYFTTGAVMYEKTRHGNAYLRIKAWSRKRLASRCV